ncbi:MAG: hypothetical protein M1813_006601 [Trichoglossum hirsutum]|nr:MAG: hypothetical protein M1813_006601 [Trichoglossum hirsutum]
MSWQSAFWLLVALALNSMMQPSGRVCGFPPAYRTPLRSSPIVCLVDATEVLFQLAYYILHGNWPWKAAQEVTRHRFQNFDRDNDGLAKVEENKHVRLVLFVLGVLPQVVKLCAVTGIPWTKTWGSMYLASFVVTELVVVIAGRGEHKTDETNTARHEHELETARGTSPQNQEPNEVTTEEQMPEVEASGEQLIRRKTAVWLLSSRIPTLLAMCFQSVLCTWAFASAVYEVLTSGKASNPTKTVVRAMAFFLPLLYLATAAWGVLGLSLSRRRLSVSVVASVIITPASALVAGYIQFYARLLDVSMADGGFLAFTSIYTIIMLLLIGYWSNHDTHPMALPLRHFFVLANLLTALLYYRFKYNPEGTSKPSWVEVFG